MSSSLSGPANPSPLPRYVRTDFCIGETLAKDETAENIATPSRVFEESVTHLPARPKVHIQWYHKKSLKIAESIRPRFVLDVGAGEGLLLAAIGPEVITCGLDLSARRLAGLVSPQRLLCQADAQAIPIASGVFDVVFCHQMIEHVPNRRRLLEEIRRVMTPGGTLVISTPIPHLLSHVLARSRNKSGRRVLSYDHVNEYNSESELIGELAATGEFKIVETEGRWERTRLSLLRNSFTVPVPFYYRDVCVVATKE